MHILGSWVWVVSLIYLALFVFAIGSVIYNLVKCFQAKFANKKHDILVLLLIIVMLTPFFMEGGLFPKKMFYKREVLVAYLDGVAGNAGWLTLYGNNMYEYNYSSAIYLKGKYKVKNDTIYFDSPINKETYDFDYAIFWNHKSHISFGKDSVAFFRMAVIKNNLFE